MPVAGSPIFDRATRCRGAVGKVGTYQDSRGRKGPSPATRSDLPRGAGRRRGSHDRQLLAREPVSTGGGFGAEVRDATERRVDYLAGEGLARRQGQRVVFARATSSLRRGSESLMPLQRSSRTRQAWHTDRLATASTSPGPFGKGCRLRQVASPMIDQGLGFRLVPWKGACCVDFSAKNRDLSQ
jgi:hypothetical protein